MTPSFDNGLVQIYQGDARAIPLPDKSVHCVVTSPPYWQQRVYAKTVPQVWAGDPDCAHLWEPGQYQRIPFQHAFCSECDAWLGFLGMEPTVDRFIANMVEVFREVQRVLRNDGVCWVNMGDKIDGSNLGLPHCLAFALVNDGWQFNEVIWFKPSPMPESLAGWRWERCRVKVKNGEVARIGDPSESGRTGYLPNNGQGVAIAGQAAAQWVDCDGCAKCSPNDGLVLRKGSWRCTTAHEVIFMLTKRQGYWADGEAVRETAKYGYRDHSASFISGTQNKDGHRSGGGTVGGSNPSAGRNRRSVWTDVRPVKTIKKDHHATFPLDLPRICIQASTSEMGCCPECGSQITRIIDKPKVGTWHDHEEDLTQGGRQNGKGPANTRYYDPPKTVGWRPSCGHIEAKNPIPSLVLDPFAGTATTCVAAMRLNRRAVGVDLSKYYLDQAAARLTAEPMPLPLTAG